MMRGEWLFQIAPHYFRISDITNVETKRELQTIESFLVQGSKKDLSKYQKKN